MQIFLVLCTELLFTVGMMARYQPPACDDPEWNENHPAWKLAHQKPWEPTDDPMTCELLPEMLDPNEDTPREMQALFQRWRIPVSACVV